jgi:hypothetical protein
MRKILMLTVLPLITGLLWIGTAPSHASGEKLTVAGVDAVGCNAFDWQLHLHRTGLDGGYYTFHTQVVSDGQVFMNEGLTEAASSVEAQWKLYPSFSYGAVDNPGTWPITPGKPMKVVLTIERPIGTVLSSWTIVASSCDAAPLLYTGPTSEDVDEDYVRTPTDLCPTLKAFRASGCPLHDRTLSLKARYGPKRLVGQLFAAGHPALYAGRTVTIWKVRPGPDRKVASRTTTSAGNFKVRVRKGRYYATAPALTAPSAGQVTADRSAAVRVR